MNNKIVSTKNSYEHYKETCFKNGLKPVTRRRFFDILTELEVLGFIKIKVVSKKREISLATSKNNKNLSGTFQNVLNAIMILQKKWMK